LKAFFRIADRWKLDVEQQLTCSARRRSTFFKWKKDQDGHLTMDALERISTCWAFALHILLRTRTPRTPARKLNTAPLLRGNVGPGAMMSGQVDLYVVRQYLTLSEAAGRDRRARAVRWSPSWRVIPTRYTEDRILRKVADADDMEITSAVEQMTSDRRRQEDEEVSFVPPKERVTGSGSEYIMAPFTYRNPDGVLQRRRPRRLLCGAAATVVEETRHHLPSHGPDEGRPHALSGFWTPI
jgi:hypothetical protein